MCSVAPIAGETKVELVLITASVLSVTLLPPPQYCAGVAVHHSDEEGLLDRLSWSGVS